MRSPYMLPSYSPDPTSIRRVPKPTSMRRAPRQQEGDARFRRLASTSPQSCDSMHGRDCRHTREPYAPLPPYARAIRAIRAIAAIRASGASIIGRRRQHPWQYCDHQWENRLHQWQHCIQYQQRSRQKQRLELTFFFCPPPADAPLALAAPNSNQCRACHSGGVRG
eukprot:856627-Rhodomonas_salina.1